MPRGVCPETAWKPGEDLLLAAGWPSGVPADELAAELGRTVPAVRNRAKALGLKRSAAWTPEMDRALRERYGKPGQDTRGLARQLGKSAGAVKQRAMKLGLRSYRWWSRAELKVLRARYGKEDAIHIARDLGRTRGQVHRMAAKLGLHRWPRIPARQIAGVKRLYADGLPDTAIARRLRLPYWRVKHVRTTYVRKPPHPDPEAKRRAVANQLKTLGLRSPTELRTRAFRRFARENGWPEDLRPREVQILNVLATRPVPLDRFELAEAIGMRTDRVGPNGSPALLYSNGPGGSYTASLARRGLIVRLTRAAQVLGRGKGKSRDLYTLGPEALRILQERVQCPIDKSRPATATAAGS